MPDRIATAASAWPRLAIGLAWAAGGEASAEPRSTSTVGMPAKIEQLVLPGTELEVKPLEDRRAPVVVRITAVYPHGSAFRYDLSLLRPGAGRVRPKHQLRRKDGSPSGDLPSIPVKVDPVLPPGQVEPHRAGTRAFSIARGLSPARWRSAARSGARGWRRSCCSAAARRSRRRPQASRPVTLADRLRPLVDAAVAGKLEQGQHAELERLLIGYWRKRLGLEQARPAEAIAAMRQHPEAGPLLRRLEEWLHRPGDKAEPVDVAGCSAPVPGSAARCPG